MIQPSEFRCEECNKLLLGIAHDFMGAVSLRCQRCKVDRSYPLGAPVSTEQIRCTCRKWLLCGEVTAGSVRVQCTRDRVLAIVTPNEVLLAEQSRATIKVRRDVLDHRPMVERDVDFAAMIESRWEGHRQSLVRRSVDLAVGLRFDVFNRDGFRCRYCGRGPEQGVYLEADHVIPRSRGGLDLMSNLVTACWDCNRGKAAKGLTTEFRAS